MAMDKDKKKKPFEAKAEETPKKKEKDVEAPEGEEDENPVEEEGSEEVPTDVPGEGEEEVEKDKGDDLSELITALAEHGINLDMDAVKSPKDLVTHLTIALNALKGVLQPGMGAGAGNDKVEEQPSASLSHEDPDPKYLEIKSKLAASQLKHVTNRIDSLVANGQASPAKANSWKKDLGEHQLGLADEDPDAILKKAIAEIDYAESEVPAGTLYADASKKLVSKGGAVAQLSLDEVQPVENQTWGDQTTDPAVLKARAEKFMKETNMDYL